MKKKRVTGFDEGADQAIQTKEVTLMFHTNDCSLAPYPPLSA